MEWGPKQEIEICSDDQILEFLKEAIDDIDFHCDSYKKSSLEKNNKNKIKKLSK